MKVGIIGAGVLGLTAGYELAKAGHGVVIFEKWPGLGGQASTFPVEGTRLERYYHHLFLSDRDEISLMQELGIDDRLLWIKSKVGFFHGGRIYDFVSPFDLLHFDALPLADRVRVGMVTLYLQWLENWRPLEEVTAVDWCRGYFGQRATQVIWEPLLKGKFGDYFDQVNMAWLWGKIKVRRNLRRPETLGKELLGYPQGSFEIIFQALASRIQEMGGNILLDQPVTKIVVEGGRAVGIEIGGPGSFRKPYEEWRGEERYPVDFDAIIATVPNFIFLHIAPPLPEDYARELREVKYQSALTMLLKLKRSISHIYWLNISDPEIPFVGIIEQTNFIPPEDYGGKRFAYVANYVDKCTHPLYPLSNEELLSAYLPGLKKINPQFSRDWIEEFWVFREDAAQPIITRGYSRRTPPFPTPMPGLYLSNTTQIYPEDRGTNYSVRLGRLVSKFLLDKS